MSQLNAASLLQLPKDILKPRYDREQTGRGIVHIGPGAFHRAHQAVYTDLAMSQSGGNWRIDQVSMRSQDLRDKLEGQDNLYALMVLDDLPYVQVIGAVNNIFVLDQQRSQVMEAMCSVDTYIITLTITEKGYCLNSGGQLDRNNQDIQHDLKYPDMPKSAIGLLTAVLKARRGSGRDKLTIISCDNLSDNGTKLAQAVWEFANGLDPHLANWIAHNICFPNTMVDSITPASNDVLRQQLVEQYGLSDAWPIQREAFSQWVIEDKFSGPRPQWEKVGVTFTDDVHLYEKAKLRILNGTHSTLAYLGSLCDFETVYAVISEAPFEEFLRNMLIEEILPSIGEQTSMDLSRYADDILLRYHNKHIRHLLSQIAWDGSQKLPFRILNSIRDNLNAQRSIAKLCVPIAAWCLYIAKRQRQGQQLVDPLDATLLALADKHSGNPIKLADAIMDLNAVFAELSDVQVFRQTVQVQLSKLVDIHPSNLADCLGALS